MERIKQLSFGKIIFFIIYVLNRVTAGKTEKATLLIPFIANHSKNKGIFKDLTDQMHQTSGVFCPALHLNKKGATESILAVKNPELVLTLKSLHNINIVESKSKLTRVSGIIVEVRKLRN
jgi:hypothetical protein